MRAVVRNVLPGPARNALKRLLGSIGRAFERIPETARFLGTAGSQTFFGYYDVSPFSSDNRYVLACVAPKENVSPHGSHPGLQIGVFDLRADKPQFRAFGVTDTWNWQQGCRLQWFPQDRPTSDVVYNALVEGSYRGVIQDIGAQAPHRILPKPIYAVSPDGKRALGLNFGRLHKNRAGYGYSNVPDEGDENGIYLIDVMSAESRTILDMEELKAYRSVPSMKGAVHYLNHLSFSPTGRRFMVTHIWLTADGKRRTRIIVADIDGKIVSCPNSTGSTSHYCWVSDEEIVIFAANERGLSRYRSYGISEPHERAIAPDVLKQDGHPTDLGDGRMLTDCYPDHLRLQKVMLWDAGRNSVETLASFYTPGSFFGEVRCDLHPRLSSDHRKICVDVVRDDCRKLCVFDLAEH